MFKIIFKVIVRNFLCLDKEESRRICRANLASGNYIKPSMKNLSNKSFIYNVVSLALCLSLPLLFDLFLCISLSFFLSYILHFSTTSTSTFFSPFFTISFTDSRLTFHEHLTTNQIRVTNWPRATLWYTRTSTKDWASVAKRGREWGLMCFFDRGRAHATRARRRF